MASRRRCVVWAKSARRAVGLAAAIASGALDDLIGHIAGDESHRSLLSP